MSRLYRGRLSGRRPPPIASRQQSTSPAPPPNNQPASTGAEQAIAWLTAALLLVGIVSAVATGLQWSVAQSALQFSRDAANSASTDTAKALTLTRNAVAAFERQARASGNLARSSNVTASATTRAADATVAQIRQRDDQFALEQRPVIRWDADADINKVDYFTDNRATGQVFWDYGFKNFGRSIAYDVKAFEALTIYGEPLSESLVNVAKEFSPNQYSWRRSSQYVGASRLPVGLNSRPTLRVRFLYKDALGRSYSSVLCLRLIPPSGFPADCTQESIASAPARISERAKRPRN